MPWITNHQGGTGYVREPKSELFLLAVANLVGQRSFYESTESRDERYTRLVRQLAVSAPVWTLGRPSRAAGVDLDPHSGLAEAAPGNARVLCSRISGLVVQVSRRAWATP